MSKTTAAAARERRAVKLVAAIEQAQARVELLQDRLRHLTPLSVLNKRLADGTMTPEQYCDRLIDMGLSISEAVSEFIETKNTIPNNDIPELPSSFSGPEPAHWKYRLSMPKKSSTRKAVLTAPSHTKLSNP